MKLLNIGAGVIGTTYAWQLMKAGYDVTILVRKGRKALIEQEGIKINYTDLRVKPKKVGTTIFKPSVIDGLESGHNFDLIIVSILNYQLEPLLEDISKKIGQANLLFFLNIWSGTDLINKYLDPEQYFFGFAHTVGGGRENGIINTIIFNEETQLGEVDGKTSTRLDETLLALKKAGMNPEINPRIVDWLTTHYVQQSSTIGGMLEAGSVEDFINSSALIKRTLLAYREGMKVCRARGIDPKRVIPMPILLLHAPMFLLVPAFKKLFSDEEMTQMLKGHLGHGATEMVQGYLDVLESGEKLNVSMPYWKSFLPVIQNFLDNQTR